ncbi:CDP-glycerol glycerophosphotransferase family protein [Ureibacillus sp. 179-F W5.1 NHS]|uniref:CDP-glycerol glycerophosphotransferase family protein n=1 Tax=Ureibacillus sp. 179-F W5.1 NHS TaxID=3374297 RepID=UPI0038791515
MVREISVIIYLFFYKCFFTLFKLFPQKNKIVLIASFKDNCQYIHKELNNVGFSGEVILLCKKSCYQNMKTFIGDPVYLIESGKLIHELKAAYHLMTARTVVVDNYYGFLAVADFRDNVECIQIWHAAGAIKNFGFLDPTVQNRSIREKKRILAVYKRFHKVVVNSQKFADIFEEAFQLEGKPFLPFGYPRTDFFFQKSLHKKVCEMFYAKYPHFKGKKIILYAPTYRPNSEANQLKLDIDKLANQLQEEYVLFVRMHPSVNLTELDTIGRENFVYDFSREATINQLLIVADYLITDYSSIPFEFAFLKKPMIFYPYDLQNYMENPGLWDKYENIVPGPIAYNTEEIIKLIESYPFHEGMYELFNEKWNEYSDGISTQKIVQYIMQRHS